MFAEPWGYFTMKPELHGETGENQRNGSPVSLHLPNRACGAKTSLFFPMTRMIFAFTAFSICFFNITQAADFTDTADMTAFEELYRCAQNNTSCGGKLAVQTGKMRIDPKLRILRMTDFPGNCGLAIRYFMAHITGESILKMPDGKKLNFGKYDFTLTSDYQYVIYSKMRSTDIEPCRLAGTVWSPDDGSTRQENIDKTNKLLKINRYLK